MSQVATEIHFVDPTKEGLDFDTDPTVIEVGNSRYRLCCRSQRSGKVENVKGNTLVEFTMPSGVNIAMFCCSNTTEEYVIWGVFNDHGNDLLLKYTIATNQIDLILGAPNPLNFDPEHPPYNPKIVGDELLYTDGLNEPRSFDIEKARRFTAGTGDGYVVVDEQVIEAIKRPPLEAPDIDYISDPNHSYNHLRGKMWQFAYRWVYDDNAKSVLSPHSRVAKPDGDELVGGLYVDNFSMNNCIEVEVETGHHIVERIEIFARDSNISDWFIVDVLDKEMLNIPSFSTFTYRYYNNTNRLAVDQNEVNRLFDMLPAKAKQQELVNGEYLVYGNYLDGRDNIEVEASIGFDIEQISFGDSQNPLTQHIFMQTPVGVTFKLPTNLTENHVVVVTFYIKDDVSGVFPAWFNDTSSTDLVGTYVATYVVRDGDTPEDVAEGICDSINEIIDQTFGDITAGIPPINTIIAFPVVTPTSTADFIVSVNFTRNSDLEEFRVTEVLTTVYQGLTKYPSLKQGSYHQFGLVYSDRQGRLGTTQTSDNMRVYIPYWSEWVPVTFTNAMRRYRATFDIGHQPPPWAHKCHIVYSKNQSQLNHLQYLVAKSDISHNAVSNRWDVAINTRINAVNDVWNNSVVGTYNWVKGDRLRIMYKVINFSLNMYTVLPRLLDVEILYQDPATGNIEIPLVDLDSFGIGVDGTHQHLLIEIYTPRKEAIETERFWEIAHSLDITDPGTPARAHSPSSGIIDSGDVYISHRIGLEGGYPCESKLYSDFYESNDFDYGRPNITNKDAREQWMISYYRAGGRKILDTKLNELYRFDAETFDSIGEMHGGITGLRQIGDTLKIYLENKCASQYIFRTALVDVTGEQTLHKSDKLFGSKILSTFEYGCQDPGSIVVNDRHVYFLDSSRGVYCRDAANGIFPISSYKAVRFWREKSEIMRMNRGKYRIRSVYNKDFNELNVSVISKTAEGGEPYFDSFTILFMEEENRWKTFMPYLPDTYGRLASQMLSFKEGQLYVHDSNEIRNQFYGVKYPMIIDVYGNMPPKENKVFDALAIHANSPFASPNDGDVFVVPSESYPDGMISRLKESRFELLEGVYYASFMNDIGDPSFDNPAEALFNGRPLRGKVIKVTLSNNDNSAVSLSFVTIKATISEHTD